MRSPRRVCSNGSSHTAHSLPTNVLSRRVRLLSVSNMPAIPPPARLRKSFDALLFHDCSDADDGDVRGAEFLELVMFCELEPEGESQSTPAHITSGAHDVQEGLSSLGEYSNWVSYPFLDAILQRGFHSEIPCPCLSLASCCPCPMF
jgi:hypothetical protein